MAHPYHHAESSARTFGGEPEDYVDLHEWFDASKEHYAKTTHRALRHHSQGIYEAQRVFGETIENSDGKKVPTRLLGEQHVKEDLGRIPSLAEWLDAVQLRRWMVRPTHSIEEARDQANTSKPEKKPGPEESTIEAVPPE